MSLDHVQLTNSLNAANARIAQLEGLNASLSEQHNQFNLTISQHNQSLQASQSEVVSVTNALRNAEA